MRKLSAQSADCGANVVDVACDDLVVLVAGMSMILAW